MAQFDSSRRPAPDTAALNLRQLKDDAKLIKKTRGISQTAALNEVARERGFRDWNHLVRTAEHTSAAAPVGEPLERLMESAPGWSPPPAVGSGQKPYLVERSARPRLAQGFVVAADSPDAAREKLIHATASDWDEDSLLRAGIVRCSEAMVDIGEDDEWRVRPVENFPAPSAAVKRRKLAEAAGQLRAALMALTGIARRLDSRLSDAERQQVEAATRLLVETHRYTEAAPVKYESAPEPEKLAVATHTILPYLYRDAANYKQHAEICLNGTFTAAQLALIRDNLGNLFNDSFIPSQIGYPDLQGRFGRIDPDDDHVWHELLLDDREERRGPCPDPDARSCAEFAELFRGIKWDDVTPYKELMKRAKPFTGEEG